MCLATPVRIKRLAISDRQLAILDDNREVSVSLVPDAKKGDWLLCHGDLAINKIDADEARTILRMINKCHHKHNTD